MLSANAQAFCVESLLMKNSRNGRNKSSTRPNHDPPPGSTRNVISSTPNYQQDSLNGMKRGAGNNNILCENQIKIELCQNELWVSFHRLGTEMIVTKSGRRMFPALRVKVSGLQPEAFYQVSLTFQPVDKRKYRYVYYNSKWMVAGVGDIIPANQSYKHPNCPMSGSYIMSQVLSFEKIKLTNHESPTSNQISLVSMQKFRPCIHLVEVINNEICTNTEHCFSFTQTSFIAVTAYQNQEDQQQHDITQFASVAMAKVPVLHSCEKQPTTKTAIFFSMDIVC